MKDSYFPLTLIFWILRPGGRRLKVSKSYSCKTQQIDDPTTSSSSFVWRDQQNSPIQILWILEFQWWQFLAKCSANASSKTGTWPAWTNQLNKTRACKLHGSTEFSYATAVRTFRVVAEKQYAPQLTPSLIRTSLTAGDGLSGEECRVSPMFS